jgi:hypothetical protein
MLAFDNDYSAVLSQDDVSAFIIGQFPAFRLIPHPLENRNHHLFKLMPADFIQIKDKFAVRS